MIIEFRLGRRFMWVPFILVSALCSRIYVTPRSTASATTRSCPCLFLATLCGSLGFAAALAAAGQLQPGAGVTPAAFGLVALSR
jgi:hypothetical protein